MHRTALRPGLDVLRPTPAINYAGCTVEIHGLVTRVLNEVGYTHAMVPGFDGWHQLPEIVEVEPIGAPDRQGAPDWEAR